MSTFPRKFGRYQLVGHLSNGGMAQVYLARVLGQAQSATKVIAIKTVLPALSDDQSFVKLFEREIGLAMALSHPNIVRIYDFGVVDREYFLAMEFVHGKNLQAVCAKLSEAGTAPPVGFAAHVTAQVCKALGYAHGYCDPVSKTHLGIIHRDISPHNVLVGYNGQVKLFDFGVAKVGSKEGQTEAGVVKGKPAYLAPEQATGEQLDDRVDIFALGIVFWELLTAKRLFFDSQPLLAIKKVVEMEIPAPSKVNPAVPAVFDKIALKALERDKIKRYQLCKEFCTDLERALHNEGIVYGEKQVRELMQIAFQSEMADELQAIQQKFSGRPQEPGAHEAPPPLPVLSDARTGNIKLPARTEFSIPASAPQNGAADSRGGQSFGRIALALALVAFGGWGALRLQPGEGPQRAPAAAAAPAVAAKEPAATARALATPMSRSEIHPSAPAGGPLDGLDVEVISLIGSSVGSTQGTVTVKVTPGSRRNTALVLVNVEPVAWHIEVEPGVVLERLIVVNGDESQDNAISVIGPAPSRIEYLTTGFYPFATENLEALPHRPDLLRKPIRTGTPEDMAYALGTEICFQDALTIAVAHTGHCMKVK